MRIYQHRDSITASAGSTTTISLDVVGGLCRQFLVKAGSDSTIFKANVVDYKELTVLDYGFHSGILNDKQLDIPMSGKYTINVTNASPDDTFSIYLGVQE